VPERPAGSEDMDSLYTSSFVHPAWPGFRFDACFWQPPKASDTRSVGAGTVLCCVVSSIGSSRWTAARRHSSGAAGRWLVVAGVPVDGARKNGEKKRCGPAVSRLCCAAGGAAWPASRSCCVDDRTRLVWVPRCSYALQACPIAGCRTQCSPRVLARLDSAVAGVVRAGGCWGGGGGAADLLGARKICPLVCQGGLSAVWGFSTARRRRPVELAGPRGCASFCYGFGVPTPQTIGRRLPARFTCSAAPVRNAK